MNFGEALAILKAGGRVSRQGWNGQGMHIYLVGPGRYAPKTPAAELIAQEQIDGCVPYKPYLALRCVDGEVVPWLASQTDILAEDWKVNLRVRVEYDETIDPASEAIDIHAGIREPDCSMGDDHHADGRSYMHGAH